MPYGGRNVDISSPSWMLGALSNRKGIKAITLAMSHLTVKIYDFIKYKFVFMLTPYPF